MLGVRKANSGSQSPAVSLGAASCAGSVAVVGTGVVGLAAALGCAQLGLPVHLIGPVPAAVRGPRRPEFDARIYAIAHASRQLLEDQKVWGQVDSSRVCPIAQMRVFGDDGGEITFDAHAAGVEELAVICEEGEMLRALWLACSMAPAIVHVAGEFESATFLAAGEPVRDSKELAATGPRVRIHLRDGTALEADLLLGADGKRSSVRAAAGFNAQERSFEQTAFVANFACARPHHGTACQWFTEEGVVALLPLPGNFVSLVWSAPNTVAAQLDTLSDESFGRRVAARSGNMLGELAMQGSKHAFALDALSVDRMVRPGLALLGDAAHVVHPLAGQGLNLGLQDVSELLATLAARETWRSVGDGVCLRRFERARAEPLGLMRGTVDGLATLFGTQDARVRRMRNWGMSTVNAIAPLKNALIRHALG